MIYPDIVGVYIPGLLTNEKCRSAASPNKEFTTLCLID